MKSLNVFLTCDVDPIKSDWSSFDKLIQRWDDLGFQEYPWTFFVRQDLEIEKRFRDAKYFLKTYESWLSQTPYGIAWHPHLDAESFEADADYRDRLLREALEFPFLPVSRVGFSYLSDQVVNLLEEARFSVDTSKLCPSGAESTLGSLREIPVSSATHADKSYGLNPCLQAPLFQSLLQNWLDFPGPDERHLVLLFHPFEIYGRPSSLKSKTEDNFIQNMTYFVRQLEGRNAVFRDFESTL